MTACVFHRLNCLATTAGVREKGRPVVGSLLRQSDIFGEGCLEGRKKSGRQCRRKQGWLARCYRVQKVGRATWCRSCQLWGLLGPEGGRWQEVLHVLQIRHSNPTIAHESYNWSFSILRPRDNTKRGEKDKEQAEEMRAKFELILTRELI